MSLEILAGRSKSGKTKYIYNCISRLVSQNQEAILIVPDQFTHRAEKSLLELTGSLGPEKAEVYSFSHLATESEARMGYSPTPRINPVARALIIKSILNENRFDFYRNSGEQNGFADLVAGSLEEFKKYMISPEGLKEICTKTEDEVLRMKLKDMCLMYAKYEEKISSVYCDSGDELSVFAGRLKESVLLANKHVFLDEFDTFVPQELEVIKALLNSCKSLTISLCIDEKEKNTTLFMPTKDTLKKLVNLSDTDVHITKLSETHFTSAELSFLEKNLYSFSSSKFNNISNDIEVFSFANPLSEVENCALRIKKLVREQGYLYRDIGVVCSDMDVYRRHIERVFDFAEINYFTDVKNDVINHHLVRFVLGLIEIYTDDYSYNSVFNYLKTAFVTDDSTNIASLEKLIQKTGIRRRTWLDDEKWSKLLDNYYGDDSIQKDIINNIRNTFIIPLANMHEKIKGRNTVRHDAEVLYEYMLSLDLPNTISSYIERFAREGELRLSKEYEKIWEIIVSTLDEIVLLNGDTMVSPATFHDFLVTAFSQHKVGFIPSTIDGVLVGNIERTRFTQIRALFVLGTNENVFPMAPKPDGIFGDADKEAMLSCGVEFSTTSSVAAFYSQYRVYRTLTTPTEKLCISYSKSDNDFKTLHKSYVVDRITKMFSLKEHSEYLHNDIRNIYSKGPAREQLCENMASYINGTDIDSRWKNLYNYFKTQGDFGIKADKFLQSDNLSHKISQNNLKHLIPILSHTSVSKIERYMACKYAYFIDYIMRLEKPKDMAVDALDIGNITHALLEKLSREFVSDMSSLASCRDEDVEKRIDVLIDEYLNQFSAGAEELSPRDAYIIKRLKNSVLLCFNAVKNQFLNSAFRPLGYEIEFSDSSELGPITLPTENNIEVKLTGKIDRADIFTKDGLSYIRVIDYKTGSKELKLDDVFYGINVQLMVYLNKLVSGDESFRHGGALYFPVSDIIVKGDTRLSVDEVEKSLDSSVKLKGIVPINEEVLCGYDEKFASSVRRSGAGGKGVSLDDFSIIGKYLENKLSDICSEMISGNFDISPYKKKNFSPCEYCNYASICRFDPSCNENKYRYCRPISSKEDIIKEMEEKLNVDTSAKGCN